MIEHILSNILGDIRKHNPDGNQLSFDCPECSARNGLVQGDGKGKLEVNYGIGLYNCWVCGESHNTKGTLNKLIRKYGNKQTWDFFNEFDFETKEIKLTNKTIKKVDGFIKLYNDDRLSKREYVYKLKALNYLYDRGFTDDLIKFYRLGYTLTDKKFKYRIIIPSYDRLGQLNYYVGRSFVNHKLKYLIPDTDKSDIIFNEKHINWYSDIYLVEGVFDHMVIPNSIPLLGKVLSDYLYEILYYNAKANIIIVLDKDAEINSNKIYNRLNHGNLKDRVRNYIPNTEDDVSSIYQNNGYKGIVEFLKQ